MGGAVVGAEVERGHVDPRPVVRLEHLGHQQTHGMGAQVARQVAEAQALAVGRAGRAIGASASGTSG
jgi:hypothetical protein